MFSPLSLRKQINLIILSNYMPKKLILTLTLLIASLFTVRSEVLADGLSIKQNYQSGKTYTVKNEDTLWGISQKFYGTGFKWGELQIQREDGRTYNISEVDPRKLFVGTKILFKSNLFKPYNGYVWVENYGIDIDNNIYTVSRNYDGMGVVNKDKEIYGGPFYYIRDLKVIDNNIIYLADTKEVNDRNCGQYTYHGFQFVFNKNINPHYSCGWDYKLFELSPDKKHYAIRNNYADNTKPDKFLILSDLGNGEYYDYLDSIYWLNNETIVYRAQNNDEWRVVINHKDIKVHEYLEDLTIREGTIYYKARENGIMVDKKIEY